MSQMIGALTKSGEKQIKAQSKPLNQLTTQTSHSNMAIIQDEFVKHFIAYETSFKNASINFTWHFKEVHLAVFNRESIASVLACVLGSILRYSSTPSSVTVTQKITDNAKNIAFYFEINGCPFDKFEDIFSEEDLALINIVYAKYEWILEAIKDKDKLGLIWRVSNVTPINADEDAIVRQLQANELSTQEQLTRSFPENCKVLIHEHNPELKQYLMLLFSKHAIAHYADTFDQLYNEAIEFEPDVIVSDWGEHSSISTLQHFKSDPNTQHIPIFLLASANHTDQHVSAYANGGIEVISKPFSAEELLFKVANIINLLRSVARRAIEQKSNLHLLVDNSEQREAFTKQLDAAIFAGFCNPEFSVELLAENLRIPVRQLERKMKKLSLGTPAKRINYVRVKKAYEALCKGKAVKKVMIECGFSSQAQFTRLFAKAYHLHPSKIAALKR
jgi:AraC-like DNA-binding protein